MQEEGAATGKELSTLKAQVCPRFSPSGLFSATRRKTTLSSNVNLHHAINLRDVSKDNMARVKI